MLLPIPEHWELSRDMQARLSHQRPRGYYPQARESTDNLLNVIQRQEADRIIQTTNDFEQSSDTNPHQKQHKTSGDARYLAPPFKPYKFCRNNKTNGAASTSRSHQSHSQLPERHYDKQLHWPLQPCQKIYGYQNDTLEDERREDRTMRLFFRFIFPHPGKTVFEKAYKLKYGAELPQWVGKA